MIHEYGHHSSMSHPHDGYDSRTASTTARRRDTYFAWLGDESNSMMSYIDLNWDFSQFDRDNSARHHAAGYAKIANNLAATVPGDPGGKITSANSHISLAQMAFATHQYGTALTEARLAYEDVAAAAALAGVPINVLQPSTWTVIGPVKNGNGPNSKGAKGKGAKDLEEKENIKRMFSP